MNLDQLFTLTCREMAGKLNLPAPSVKKITSGKNGENRDGTAVRLTFEEFKLDIYYIESGKYAFAQQTLWLSFVLDADPTYPFSVYDILAIVKPDDFNCYTYSYVDSNELMFQCMHEIEKLISWLCPALSKVLSNGIEKNKLITAQKENINNFFGDNVIESSELIGDKADRLITMMIHNFFEAEIECAVVGSQAMFFAGKEDKALKRLKKSKRNTLYLKNLLAHIENGGKATLTEAAAHATTKKGAVRHGASAHSMVKMFFIYIALSLICGGVMALITWIIIQFKHGDAVYVMGMAENLINAALYAQVPAFVFTLKVTSLLKSKGLLGKKRVQAPKNSRGNELLKYTLIGVESLAIILCISCANSVTPFYEDHFNYATDDFIVLRQEEVNYSSVDYFAVIDGYMYNDEFIEEPYVAAHTKSGTVIDLYNSSYISNEDFEKTYKNLPFEKNIPLKSFKTEDDLLK